MRGLVGLVAFVLRAAPPSFRDRHEAEYLVTVGERLAAAARNGPGRAIWLGARELAGALRLVARLRTGAGGARAPAEKGKGGGASMLETIINDGRQALRGLARNPGFSVAAVVVLALGIGANTAIFSAANAFLFRPLPFEEADRLVLLYETNPEFGWDDATAAPANALDWRDQVEAFADVAMYAEYGVDEVAIQRAGEPVLVGGSGVTGNFFSVLGVDAALGRTFRYGETWAGDDAVVVISHRLWANHFGSDPGVVGTVIPFGGGGTEVEIIGVAPEGFSFPSDRTDLWYTYGWATTAREEVWFRRAHMARAVARLESGVSIEEADAQLQVVVSRLQQLYPETNSVMGAGLAPVRDFLVQDVRRPLNVLLGAVGILLLLACANVANLMLVRANDRNREVAIRCAFGAGRARVARQFLLESVLLALVGGAAGLVLGWIGIRAMESMTDLGIEGATALALDARVVGFTLLVAMLSGVLFGTVPAARGSRGDVQIALRDGGRGQAGGLRRNRIAGSLVSLEVALALILVVGAGLMVRSSLLLRRVDPGFEVEGALAVNFSVPSARYPNRDQVLGFWDRFTEALEARAGIERAGTVGLLPLAGQSWSSQFQAEGWPPDRVGFEILHRRADAGYFDALDISLLRGRMFGPADGADAPLVVLINETFAREHFPDEDPLGQKIAYDRQVTAESTWYEIIGIVGDQKQHSLKQPARAEVFENRNQDWGRSVWVVMRTSGDPMSAVPTVRSVLEEMDPQIPIAEIRPLSEVWRASMGEEAFILTLLGIFGIAALSLASVGVYGVTAQAAKRRTQEIGIRMALGADATSVLGLMLRQGVPVIAVGLVAGLATALPASRALASFLYGIEPTDPGTLAAVVALLGAVALSACYVPARRATAVDPVSSLRSE